MLIFRELVGSPEGYVTNDLLTLPLTVAGVGVSQPIPRTGDMLTLDKREMGVIAVEWVYESDQKGGLTKVYVTLVPRVTIGMPGAGMVKNAEDLLHATGGQRPH